MGGKEVVRKDGQSPASFIVEGGGRFRDYGYNRKRLALPWPAPPTKAQPALRVAAGCLGTRLAPVGHLCHCVSGQWETKFSYLQCRAQWRTRDAHLLAK